MGANFNQWHLNLVANIQDVKTDSSAITAATDDGRKRSSAQRSRDLMAARYWAWSVFKVANKQLFHTLKTGIAFAGTGIGFSDITALNVTSPRELNLVDTGALYGLPIAIVDGEELPFYTEAMRTYKRKELVAGVVNDQSGASQKMRLKLVIGKDLDQDSSKYPCELGYYDNPRLEDLTAASANDITEPRSWWDAIERYAEYLAWKASTNYDRAAQTRVQAFENIKFLVLSEYGSEAADRVGKYLDLQGVRQ